MRAQTAASLPSKSHNASTVTVNLPQDFSFLKSPRAGEDDDCAGGGGEEDEGGGGGGDHGRESGRGGGGTDSFFARSGNININRRPGRDSFLSATFGDSNTGNNVNVNPYFAPNSNNYTNGNFASARSVSQDEEMFERGMRCDVNDFDRSGVFWDDGGKAAKYSIPRSAAKTAISLAAVVNGGSSSSDSQSAKECEEDEDCRTGRSTITINKLRY